MDVDSDVPDSGAAFTFGKSRFALNLPGKFWIRDDPILQVACGDEHTALLTASGRVFTFGNNEWGQLGHGHTNSLSKPSCVKGVKHERATVIACGRSHTLVATDSGHVYGFGANGEGQLGSPHEYTIHSAPVRIQGLEDVTVKMLAGGADHSMALTDKGSVYVWGSGLEGQLGLEKVQCLVPTELKFDHEVMCITAGYYHSAFVTVDGKLYTCGENDCGKLGVSEVNSKKTGAPRQVLGIQGRVTYVSCGGNHTVALTADGKAYSFGNGFNGQLGLGDRILETCSAHLITSFENVKIARVSCGENHTGFLTDTGCLFTCGDGRHGKLALLDDNSESCTNHFFPVLVERFTNLQVQQVACGGCHMLVLANKQRQSHPSDVADAACPARERRRQMKNKLPPLQSTTSPSSSSHTMQNKRNSTLKTHPQLSNITKSPVWYIPLERTSDTSGIVDEDDEVLSEVGRRHSLLDDLEEDRSIRHVDSDVDSDNSEASELNKTHTLVRIDNTISIVRPVITDGYDDTSAARNGITEDNHKNELQQNDATAKPVINGLPDSAADQKITTSPKKDRSSSNSRSSKRNKEGRRSQFYDNDDASNSDIKSSTSTLTKSSKTCVII